MKTINLTALAFAGMLLAACGSGNSTNNPGEIPDPGGSSGASSSSGGSSSGTDSSSGSSGADGSSSGANGSSGGNDGSSGGADGSSSGTNGSSGGSDSSSSGADGSSSGADGSSGSSGADGSSGSSSGTDGSSSGSSSGTDSSSSGSSSTSSGSSSGTDSSSGSTSSSSSSGGTSSSSSGSSSSSSGGSGWTVYNGNHHPMATGAVTLHDGSLSQFHSNSATPPEADFFTVNGNGTVTFDSTANTAHRLYARLSPVVNEGYPKHLTLLAGITGNSDNVRVLEIEKAFADEGASGSRLKTILRADGSNQGVQLEQANNGDSVSAYGLDMSGFRVYQISVTLHNATQGSVQVYIDGNNTPLIALNNVAMRPAVSDGDNYVRMGDGGSHAYKAELDWVIWTRAGAFSPGELAGQLPADLGCVIGYGASDNLTDCDNPPGGNGNGNGNSNGNGSPTEPVYNVAALLPAKPVPTPNAIPSGNPVVYVAPDGHNSNNGTLNNPFATLNHAVSQAAPGTVIVMRGGVYLHGSTISINSPSGTAANPITVIAYPGETPILDFTPQTTANNAHGVRLNANHWRLIGLTIRYAGHNGIRMDGSHNRLERLVAYENYDTGIHMAGTASHNLIFNCDSYRNFNSGIYTTRIGNNADGFGAKFENLGPGNVFYGNRAWENSDDGFDFWRAPNPIVLWNNWAFGNGDGSVFNNPANFEGGGNGFKLGGNHEPGDHIVVGNMAFDNFGVSGNAKGFDHNNNTGVLTLVHNTAYNNGRNYTFPNAPANGGTHRFYNNLSIPQGAVQMPSSGIEQAGNSWQSGNTPTAASVQSVNTASAKSARQADGSLPDISLLRPAAGSFLIDGGVNVGLSFPGNAPDMGAHGYTH